MRRLCLTFAQTGKKPLACVRNSCLAVNTTQFVLQRQLDNYQQVFLLLWVPHFPPVIGNTSFFHVFLCETKHVFRINSLETLNVTETISSPWVQINRLNGKDLGPVVQKPVNVNLRLKINKGVLFSTPKCCSRLIFGKTLH